MSNYVGDNALPTQLPSLIKKQSGDYSVKSFTGTLAEPIKINDNQINVDLTKLKKIYKGVYYHLIIITVGYLGLNRTI